MAPSQRRPLALDFGRVLTLDPDPSPFIPVLEKAAVDQGAFHRAYATRRHEFDRGHLDARMYWTAVWKECAPASGTVSVEEHLQSLVDADFATWARPRPSMHRVVQEALDQHTPAAIVSNMPTGVGARFVAHWPWLARVPHRFFSADLGLAKPDPEFYRHVLRTTGWRAQDVLFVDDVEANIDAAAREGFSVLLFTGSDDDVDRVAQW